ncbi:BZ3500_MvSof-1268-A1-R1_Chr2-3g05379 [Microbotryum saponariae]|uniref:BZ3500_MvSof-1268-A1-R1_Chr2-3g05379 protein n=1 Tax=Microbotryum saponariae TaxID=289078 RepID=A0A2X0L6V3_9BASI|nr:BZ3500_MvSof-1268-A1-R1_Chr2-3g05379 [Microbotryum saponariae]SDA01319.1 BZ3501_MvSof-1269-A2-R1_Chr2-2g05052 [Microbotryum saponariae]
MVKYLWVSTTTKRSADEKQELISWLATQSSCGLGEQIKGEFYVRASASCVGKDYRFIAQIFPLVAYFFQQRMWLSQSEAECWMALGKLTRHAMRTDTDDLAAYADTYKVLATRFVLLSLQRIASHVVSKVKCHYLLHVEEAIRRFGLPRMFDSSVAESANKTVRDYCMHSNRHSPTRDIACQDSQAHRLVFIAAGGRWEAADGPKATAGPSVSQFFRVAGRERLSTRTTAGRFERFEGRQPTRAYIFDALGTTPSLRPGRFVTLRNGDYGWSRDWCFVQAGPQDQRILELWTVDGRPREVIPPFGLSFVVLAFAAGGRGTGRHRVFEDAAHGGD